MLFQEDGPAPPTASRRQENPGPIFYEMHPTEFPDMANDVCEKLTQRLHSTSTPFLLTDDETGSDDQGAPTPLFVAGLTSNLVRFTPDSQVVNRIKWLHEMGCSFVLQAPVYKDMSLALFLNGYLVIVAEESNSVRDILLRHLQELFEDVVVYGWMVARGYHAAWLQLLEQERVAWGDETKRAQLRRLIVWSKPALSSKTSSNAGSAAPPQSQPGKGQYGYVTQPSEPRYKACVGFNHGSCCNNSFHPSDLHMCSCCLRTAHKLCKHSEAVCKHKDSGTKNGVGGV